MKKNFNFKTFSRINKCRGGTGVVADAGVVTVLINAEMVLDMITSSIYNI